MAFSQQITPVAFGLRPREGSKIVTSKVFWNDPNNAKKIVPSGSFGSYILVSTRLNLQSQAQTGQFATCQTVWIDNSTCPLQVIVFEEETSQRIVAPPFTQGFYPVFASANPSFVMSAIVTPPQDTVLFANSYPNGSTTFFFMNEPSVPYVQPANFAFSSDFVSFSEQFTYPAAFANPTPILNIAVPTTGELAIALSSYSIGMVHYGPTTPQNGILACILYSSPSNITPTDLTTAFFVQPVSSPSQPPQNTWYFATGNSFTPPVVLKAGDSLWVGPVGATAANVCQISLNLSFSFVEIA